MLNRLLAPVARPAIRLGAVLAAALAGTILLGWLLGLAVETVPSPGHFPGDAPVAEELAELRSPAATRAMKVVTRLGNRGVVLAAMALIAAALWAVARKAAALFLAASVLGGYFASHFVKDLVDRVRPVEGLVDASGGSFPSGHAVASVTLYAGLAFVASRLFGASAAGRVAWAAAAFLIVSVGVSRVYLGVHWPSDVVGGILLGAIWTAVCAAVWSRRLRFGGG